jgi:hypothetical protein
MLSSQRRRKCCKAKTIKINFQQEHFQAKGICVKFMYGGDAFFDNMEDFFSNGYDIVVEKDI